MRESKQGVKVGVMAECSGQQGVAVTTAADRTLCGQLQRPEAVSRSYSSQMPGIVHLAKTDLEEGAYILPVQWESDITAAQRPWACNGTI